jgi:hypothetical protein
MAKPVYIQVSKARQWVMHQQRMGGGAPDCSRQAA